MGEGVGTMLNNVMKKHGGIYFVTSRDFGVSHAEGAEAALRGGVRIIQYREKEADTKTMIGEAREIKRLCRKYGALFLIDDRIDVALAVDSDGVHLGGDDMPLRLAKRILPNKILGASAKNAKQAREAERDGATYLGVGAIFPTSTKVKTVVIGMKGFEEVRKSTRLPVYGIGGVKAEHIRKLKDYGADGIAVISAILSQDDRVAAARELVEEWNRK